jgi:F-type H+-transporting ATPase subunit b
MQELASEASVRPPSRLFLRRITFGGGPFARANRSEAAVFQSHSSIDVSMFPHSRLEEDGARDAGEGALGEFRSESPVKRRAWHWNRLAAAALAALLVAQDASAASDNLVLVPQLVDRMLPLVALFCLLVIPVNLLIFKPLFRVLDERAERIDGARQRAERLEREADEVLERYERSVQEVREQAEAERRAHRERARAESQDDTGAVRAEADREIARARGALAQSLESTRAALRAEARELAREAAARVLGRAI